MTAAEIAPLASPTDFGTWVGASIPEDDAQITQWLIAASSLVRSAAGQDDWTADTVPAAAKGIVLQAVERKWRNPTGATSRTAGPFNEGYGGDAAHGLYLTDPEREALARYGTGASGLWVQPTTRGEHLEVHRYLDTVPSGEPVLYYADEDDLP